MIDNVYPGKSAQFWGRIKDAFEKEGREFKIDVMIQNHIEKDHSGSLVEVLKKFPDIEVYCSKKADPGLKKHYHELADCEFNIVGTGDEVSLGNKTLAFVNAPMLHWSDSMFTMLMEDLKPFVCDYVFDYASYAENITLVNDIETIAKKSFDEYPEPI